MICIHGKFGDNEHCRICEPNEGGISNSNLITADPDLLESLEGLHGALSRMIDKHDPDSIEAEWLSHSHEAISRAKGK